MNPEEIPSWLPLLKKQFLFAELAEDELRLVGSKMEPLSLPKGAMLFQQGDPADAFYLITSGEIRVLVQKGLSEKVTAYLTRGDGLGEMSLLTGEPRAVTARLDTTSEFLVLSRKSFEELVRERPGLLLHVSRLLYTKMLESSRTQESAQALVPKVLAIVSSVPAEDLSLFLIHFSLGLMSQTRRRVLLVDMTASPGQAIRAMGLKPVPISEAMLRGQDLRDPNILRHIGCSHPSGLELLSIPPNVLGGKLFRAIFLLINLLRENFDFVVVAMDKQLGEVERAVLGEADRWVVLGHAERRSEAEVVQVRLRTLSEPRATDALWLSPEGQSDPVDFSPPENRIYWPADLVQDFVRSGDPYECVARRPRAGVELERLARRFGRLRVGMAMGAGAALGYALIGMLKVFEKERIPIDIVAGTSIGGVVGAFYAAGFSPDEIAREAIKVDKSAVYENLFWDLTLPRSGLLSGANVLRYFRSYLGYKEFKDLSLPFACTATDIETGEEVVLSKGRVAEAVRASMSIPILFKPYFYGGRYLVDGGLVHPVPTQVLSKMGADILLSVNLTLPAGERKSLYTSRESTGEKLAAILPAKGPNLSDIFFKMVNTMQYQIARGQVNIANVVIEPELRDFNWTEFHRAGDIIEKGMVAAEEALPKIKKLLPFHANNAQFPIRRASVPEITSRPPAPPAVPPQPFDAAQGKPPAEV